MFTEQEINLLLKQDEASLYEALGRSVDSGRFQHIETRGFSRGSMSNKSLDHGLPERSLFHGAALEKFDQTSYVAAGKRVLENVRQKICTNETVIKFFLDEKNADQYKKIAWLKDVLILILPPVAAGIAAVFVVRDGLELFCKGHKK